MMKTKKEFDCIQVKRDAQITIYEAIQHMNPEEEIAYFRQAVDQSKFSKWWKSIPSHAEHPEEH